VKSAALLVKSEEYRLTEGYLQMRIPGYGLSNWGFLAASHYMHLSPGFKANKDWDKICKYLGYDHMTSLSSGYVNVSLLSVYSLYLVAVYYQYIYYILQYTFSIYIIYYSILSVYILYITVYYQYIYYILQYTFSI